MAEICCCKNCGWSEIVGSPIMCNYSGCRTWRDECCEAWKPKEKETNMVEVVRCKDCINCVKEPNGELYCDILAVGYEPLGSKKVNANWFCADGERAES